MSSHKIAEAQEVLEYLTAVMRGESMSFVVAVESKGKGCSAARYFEKPPSEMERLKAAELLGKYLGMWTEKKDDSAETLAKLDEVLKKITDGGF